MELYPRNITVQVTYYCSSQRCTIAGIADQDGYIYGWIDRLLSCVDTKHSVCDIGRKTCYHLLWYIIIFYHNLELDYVNNMIVSLTHSQVQCRRTVPAGLDNTPVLSQPTPDR